MDDSKQSTTELRQLVHELANPLHILKFCVGEIAKNPERAKDADFINRLTRNIEAAETTFEQLRVYARSD